MAASRKWLMPLIALVSLLIAGGTVGTPVGVAEEAVLIPGATVFKRINPLYSTVAKTYPGIGINFHDDDDPEVVDYSQNALAANRAILDGVEQADLAVRETDGKVVVIGESMGSMVASRLAAELAASSDPPSPDDIRFVLIAPPEKGVAEYFKVGTWIPVLNYRISRVAESPYATTIVIGEYDGWADPPDRPWNVVSAANALLGIVYVHGPPIFTADPIDVPPENTTGNGSVTTYFVPTEELPLTQPLRGLGVPDKLVDRVDRILRPIVDAGYRRHDQPGDSRPYLFDGRIRRNVQDPEQTRQQRHDGVGDDEQSAHPGQLLQTHAADRPDRSHLDTRRSRNDAAERRAELRAERRAEQRTERRAERRVAPQQ